MADPREGRQKALETARNASSEIRRRLRVFLSSDAVRWIRAGGFAWLLGGLGLVAGVLILLSEFTHLAYVTTITASCSDFASQQLRDNCLTVGHESHHWVFALLGLFVILMTFGAVVGGSRPAAVALLVAGALGLGITLIKDLPITTKKGEVGVAFAQGKAHKGAGFWLELVGSCMAIGLGAYLTVRTPPPRRGPRAAADDAGAANEEPAPA